MDSGLASANGEPSRSHALIQSGPPPNQRLQLPALPCPAPLGWGSVIAISGT
jgi:hypothetical protein